MKQLFLLLLLFLQVPGVFAQKDGDIWIFGNASAVDFNSGSPAAFSAPSMNSIEGCAAVADASGSLLFYSDGQKVYDRTHAVMMNGSGILGNEGYSATQGVGIFPVPGMPALYFLFTLGSYTMGSGKGYLRYSVIDMTLNGGLGGVTAGAKNVMLDSGMSEKMVLSVGCGNSWLLTHDQSKASFYAYPLTAGPGIGTPVVSVSGIGMPDRFGIGEMKISTKGTRIALANYPVSTTSNRLELYDFDHNTGIVSNYLLIDSLPFILGSSKGYYGLEFSPDGSKLYAGIDRAEVVQYDLSPLPSLAAVRASRYTVSSRYPTGFRLGPDKKIYFILRDSVKRLSRINNPDAAGALCNPETDISSLILTGYGNFSLGLRINHVPGATDTFFSRTDTAICPKTSFLYHGDPDYTSPVWHDGDTALHRTFSTPGTYWLTGYKGACSRYQDTLVIREKGGDTTFRSRTIPLCTGNLASLTASGYDHYRWPDGDTASFWVADKPGDYLLTAWKGCTVLMDMIHVVPAIADTVLHYKDTSICFTTSALLFTPSGYDRYRWDDGSEYYFNTVNEAQKEARVWCTRFADCRVDVFHYRLNFVPAMKPVLPDDTTLCSSDTLMLDATTPGASYLWSDGNRNPVRQISASGTYWVQRDIGGCIFRDTGQVTVKEVPGSIGRDTSVCADQQLVLRVDPDSGSYHWQDGSTGREFRVSRTGEYSVEISYDGCSVRSSVFVQVNNCSSCISFFNSFSPNGDGLNDRFKPLLHCPVRSLQLQVYDRWGTEVFSSGVNGASWDGKVKGQDAAPGVYFYLLKVVFDINADNGEQWFKGDLSLIR